MRCPRVLIAGTSSGCGKTTAVCALLSSLKRRGVHASALKCGPDYIDPLFHRAVLGVPSANLDPFFCTGELLRSTLAAHAGAVTVIEGVMGYYDGTGAKGTDNSTCTVARATGSPVILVVNARGASASAVAVLDGFLGFEPESHIRGVLFNGVTGGAYETLKALCRRRYGDAVRPLGYLPKLPEECLFGSRHLGLVTPEDLPDAAGRLERLGTLCEETLDVEGILALADTAPELAFEAPSLPALPPVTVAVAYDAAFCFVYEDTLALLKALGARVVTFSPLADEAVPEEADGLYLPGGYPELHAGALAQNRRAAGSVRAAVLKGMPTIAECGGFQYLGNSLDGHRMCGVLPHESFHTGHLVRFGYVTLTAKKPGLFGAGGLSLPGHEFHYYDSTANGGGFTARKISGRSWDCAVYTDTLYAGYPHLYLPACVPAAESFLRKCAEFKEKEDADNRSHGH